MDEARQGTADKLIRNVFRYMDKNARDIMTHRKNIVAIDEEESLEDALHFMLETNYSRFPIYRGSIDEIIGFMHLREAMTCYLKNNYRNVPVKELHSYIRPVDFIPESKNIDRLFKEMQAKKNHIVIVMDEYGQTSGLVTLEDILEEIVGNILDEYDVDESYIREKCKDEYIIEGKTPLDDLEELLDISFDESEFETLNGFIIAKMEHIPEPDEKFDIRLGGYEFRVLSVENKMIKTVLVKKLPEEESFDENGRSVSGREDEMYSSGQETAG